MHEFPALEWACIYIICTLSNTRYHLCVARYREHRDTCFEQNNVHNGDPETPLHLCQEGTFA